MRIIHLFCPTTFYETTYPLNLVANKLGHTDKLSWTVVLFKLLVRTEITLPGALGGVEWWKVSLKFQPERKKFQGVRKNEIKGRKRENLIRPLIKKILSEIIDSDLFSLI